MMGEVFEDKFSVEKYQKLKVLVIVLYAEKVYTQEIRTDQSNSLMIFFKENAVSSNFWIMYFVVTTEYTSSYCF